MKEISLTQAEIIGPSGGPAPPEGLGAPNFWKNIRQKSAVRDRTTIFVHKVEPKVFYKLISMHERAISNPN